MAQARSLEVKVGLLLLTGAALLTALVLVMGGVSLARRFTLYVDFENPGGLQPGAPVKIAGVRVGSVDALEFRASPSGSAQRTLVRTRISIEERFHGEIHRNAEFYVTTQGVLGEQFLAIDPGSGTDRIEAGTTVVGQGPPRIDLFVARAYTLLDDTVTAIHQNRETLHGIVRDLAGVLHSGNDVLTRNGPRVDTLLTEVNQTVRDADQLLVSARARYVDGPEVQRILRRTENVLSSVEREVPALSGDARRLMTDLRRVSGAVGEEQVQDLHNTLREVRTLAQRANTMTGEAQQIVHHVRQGRGTVGALLMDEELYDDLQELVRDLKHNPWKFFWRE